MTVGRLGIAVPSFEQPDHVGSMIASLRRLTIPFNAIVQDGGSSPHTISRLREAIGNDPRIHLVVEPDLGQSDAINRAWQVLMEDHDVLTWCNTDDEVVPGGMAALVRRLVTDPTVVVAYGDLDLIDAKGHTCGRFRAPNEVSRFRLVHHHNLVPGIVPVIRTTALQKVGLMDVDLHYAMDHDLFIRLAEHGRLVRVPSTVARYRLHDRAKTRTAKAALEGEVARNRERYRTLPRPMGELVRLGLRLAWWPTRRWYVRGESRA